MRLSFNLIPQSAGLEELGVNVAKLSYMMDLELGSLCFGSRQTFFDEMGGRPSELFRALAIIVGIVCRF